MRKTLLGCAVVFMFAAPMWAVDIPLTDGTLVEVESYKVVDGFVLLKFADGGQVAYATADVDMDALRQAEWAAAAAAAQQGEEEEQPALASGSILGAVSLQEDSADAVSITDQDVGHVRIPEPGFEGEEGDEEGDEVEEQPAEGGSVGLRGVHMERAENGWVMSGEVVNGSDMVVQDVQVEVISRADGEVIDARRITVAPSLAPGERRAFSHTVNVEERPQSVVKTFWMQPAPKE